MSQSFKFRYVNELVGGFVLAAVILAVMLVVLAGRAQGWFIGTAELYTEFSAEGAFGLKEGSEVEILETLVGSVIRIEPTEEGMIRGVMKIRRDFLPYVRSDSIALVKKKLGVGGDAYVVISQGRGDPLPPDQLFVPSQRDDDILEALQGNIEEVKAAILPTINQLRILLRESTELVVDVKDEEGPLMQTLSGLGLLVQRAGEGEGALGKLLADPETAKAIDEVTAQIQQALSRINGILENVEEASRQLPPIMNQAESQVEELPELLQQGRDTLAEAEQLLSGLQRHWLLRKYMDVPAEDEVISPAGIRRDSGDVEAW